MAGLILKSQFVGESFVKMIVHKQVCAVDGADPGVVAGAFPSVTHFVMVLLDQICQQRAFVAKGHESSFLLIYLRKSSP